MFEMGQKHLIEISWIHIILKETRVKNLKKKLFALIIFFKHKFEIFLMKWALCDIMNKRLFLPSKYYILIEELLALEIPALYKAKKMQQDYLPLYKAKKMQQFFCNDKHSKLWTGIV